MTEGLGPVRIGVLGVVALLCTALPVYSLSAISPFLVRDLQLSSTAVGSLGTVVFIVALVASPFSGRVADHMEVRTALTLLFGSSAACFLAMSALGATYAGLLAGVAIAGLGLSIANPATNRLIARYVPENRRGTLTGFKQSGGQLAPVVAGSILPIAASTIGWRPALLLFVPLAFLGLILAVGLPRSSRAVPRKDDGDASTSPTRHPRPVWLIVYSIAMGVVAAATFTHIPIFASTELAVPPARAGALVALLGVVGVLGRLGWGMAGDRRGGLDRLLTVAAILAAGAAALMAISTQFGAAWLVVAVALTGVSSQAWPVLAMLSIIRASGEAMGAHSGQVMAGVMIGGMVGPFGSGLLADGTGSYLIVWLLLALVALIAGIAVEVRRRTGSGAPGSQASNRSDAAAVDGRE